MSRVANPLLANDGSGSIRPSLGPVTLTLLVILALVASFAWAVWPPLAGDPIGIVPSMVTYARDRQLQNPIWFFTSEVDPTGQGRLTNHGFLYPMLVGLLAPSPDYAGVIRAMYALDLVALVLAAWLVRRAAPPEFRQDPWLQVQACSSILGSATMLISLLGRPDPFATLLVLAGTCTILAIPEPRDWVPAGVILGTLGCAHPVGAVLAGLSYAWYCAWSQRMAWRRAAAAAVVSAGTFSLWLAVYPYPARDWFDGLLRVAQPAVLEDWGSRFWSRELFYYWFLVPRASGIGLAFLLLPLALVLLWTRRARRGGKATMLMVLSSLLLAGALWAFVFRVHPRSYNAHLFAPLAFAVLMRATALSRREGQALHRAFALAATFALALPPLGLLRLTAQFESHQRWGHAFEEARESFAQARGRWSGGARGVAITTGLFMLTEDYAGLVQAQGAECSPGHAVLIQSQAYSGRREAPPCAGYRLVFDGYVRERPSLLGVPVGNAVLSWGFAVYVATDTVVPATVSPPAS